jgi:hypothetical protein
MNNSQKSWRGAPTTNVLTNTNLDTGWSQGYNTSIIIGDTSAGFPPGVESQVVSFIDSDNNGSGYWYSYGNFAPQADSTTYSVSVWARTVGADWVIQPYTADNSEANRVWLTAKTVTGNGAWQRLEWPNAFTTGAGWDSDSLSFQFNSIPAGQRCWLCAPQMEPLSYCTPFVNGTRSNTQSVIDLTRNNTITANSLTYASNNTFSFNGSSNFINLDNNIQSGYTSASYEFWCRPSALPGSGNYFQLYIQESSTWIALYNLGAGAFFGIDLNNGSGWFDGNGGSVTGARTTVTLAANTYYHVAYSWNGLTVSVYLNGNLQATVSTLQAASGRQNVTQLGAGGTPRNIGSRGNGTANNWIGTIDNARFYNRALTAAEVQQNFTALRGRYGI